MAIRLLLRLSFTFCHHSLPWAMVSQCHFTVFPSAVVTSRKACARPLPIFFYTVYGYSLRWFRGFSSPVTSRTLLLIFDYLRKVRESNPRVIADLLLSRELPYHSANLPFFGLSIPNQPAFVCNSTFCDRRRHRIMVRKKIIHSCPVPSQRLHLPLSIP